MTISTEKGRKVMQRLTIALLAAVTVLAASILSSPVAYGQSSPFRRGDLNQDGAFDLSDPIQLLLALFVDRNEVPCRDSADCNDDGAVDISDPLYSLIHLFVGGPAEPEPRLLCGDDPTPDSLSCVSYDPCDVVRGQSAFSTPLAGAPGGPQRGDDDSMDGGAPPENQPGPAPAPAGEPRLVEESDIYKLVGDHLFVLNRYRGLQILDLANLDSPRLVGRAPIFGYPREMYVRGTRAYVVVSDYYEFWRDAAAVETAPGGFYGSQLRIIDISDVTDPRVIGGINLDGDCSDSRIVGDVMYLVSQRYPWYFRYDTSDTVDETEILSVSIADPADVRVVDEESFPRNGWEHHIHVTEEAVYLASSGYNEPDWTAYETRIRYVDISDPAGAIAVRGEARVSGRVQDRWCMDAYQGVLRVASGQAWGNGDVYLTTFSLSDPDSIRRLGGYTLQVDESLTAARFDGPRGYLVSYKNIDPLFTFDLSDPVRPRLLGELEMTGWLDFIVPLGGGQRLVALGHEDLVDPTSGAREISLAVSLIDVSGTAAPRLLSRVKLDGAWGWVPGERDDFAKVFRTLPDQGLILFPFQAWSQTDYRYVGGVQLIDLDDTTLRLRGLIRNAGWVERGIPHGNNTVLTLSSEVFQVIDIQNRDNPRVRARLELARNVQEFALLGGDYTVQLAGDWYSGDTELVVTPIGDPDAIDPVARLHVGAPYARMFVNGSFAYVVSVRQAEVSNPAEGMPETQSVTKVQIVDLENPARPVLRGSVDLPEEVWPGYHGWYWGWGDEVVQVNGSTLAFHRFRYPYVLWDDCMDCAGGGVVGGAEADAASPPGPAGQDIEETHKIYLVDLSRPDRPEVASTLEIQRADWVWGLKAVGTMLYLSFYEAFIEGDVWMARYYLGRIDVADPAQPSVLPEVNIPGVFVDARIDSPYIYTLESWWDSTDGTSRNLFHVLAVDGDQAHLQSSVELPGYVSGVQVRGSAAFGVSYWWSSTVVPEGGAGWTSEVQLFSVDLSVPRAAAIADREKVPYDYAYLQDVEGGRAFLGSGAGIFTYDVREPYDIAFERFFRTQGWTQDVIVRDSQAFVPSGYHGVQVLELGPE